MYRERIFHSFWYKLSKVESRLLFSLCPRSASYLLPCKSVPKSMQVPFTFAPSSVLKRTWNGPGTDLERTWNGGKVSEKWKIESGKYEFRKNFFALTLHPYIATPCNTHKFSQLQGFLISPNPTLTLHQPYTKTWNFQDFRLMDN